MALGGIGIRRPERPRGDAGFPPVCPPGFLGGLPLMPKLRANLVMVAGADLRHGAIVAKVDIPDV